MFAVIQVGAKQFKVAQGDVITADRMDLDKGQKVTFDKVLLVSDGKTVKVGQPIVKGAEVNAEVVDHSRGDKVIAYQYRKRKDSARTVGHRQDLTSVKITKISV